MIDLQKPEDVNRLCTAMERSRSALRDFRDQRTKMLKAYVGSNYTKTTKADKTPMPLIAMAVEVFTRQLVSRAPAVSIATDYRSLKPTASMFELALNQMIQKSRMGKALSNWVLEAMFGLGVLKLGVKQGEDSTEQFPGYLVTECVAFDDFVWDTTATRFDKCRFMGDRFFEFADDVQAKYKLAADAMASMKLTGNLDNDQTGEMRSRALSSDGSFSNQDAGIEDQIELHEIYLVRERLKVCLHLNSKTVLSVTPFAGPRHGPYHLLGFGEVPGNAMPICPIAQLYDLHDVVNRLFNKVVRQAERQKTITVFQGGSEKDAQNVQRASDGDVRRVDQQGRLSEMSMGGADPKTLATTLQARQLFNQFGGNLEVLAGLAPQSDTVGQDQLLAASANQKIAHLKDQVFSAVESVIQDFAFYLWNDPMAEPLVVHRVPGTDIEDSQVFSAEDRVGDFFQYNFRIDPSSMGPETPETRIQSLDLALDRASKIIPLSPGMSLNGEGWLREYFSATGRRDIDALINFESPQNPLPGPTNGTPKPANRTITRVNRPGNTIDAQQGSMIRELMGAGSQPAEADAAYRSIS